MSIEDEIDEVVSRRGYDLIDIADAEPPFVYTVGLVRTSNHPELIMFGLESDQVAVLFAAMFQEIGAGKKFDEPGVREILIGQDQHRIGLRRVHPTQHPLYLGYAMGYCRHIGRSDSLAATQVFWPDISGKFPFDVGCDYEVYGLQPRLDRQLTPREIREFERLWE